MCGIAGFLSASSQSCSLDERRRLTHQLLEGITHRGPDAAGLWNPPEYPVNLGHRRLAILDLSPAGIQPMHSRSGRYSVTFNGEIYNYRELRDELEKNGAAWRGTSDTEVMLEAFDQIGIEVAIQKMVGMFALAVWDRESATLTLIRDRLGEKPLYYGWHQGKFWFASELKAIRKACKTMPALSNEAIGFFLRFNYIPSPGSVYTNIFKLYAGSSLTISPELTTAIPSSFNPSPEGGEGSLRPKRFWDAVAIYNAGSAHPLSLSDEEATEQVHSLLSRSVKQQMVSDVPLGAFLSGGIDSSCVVALMQQHSTSPIRTFSIGFHEEGFNEANHAKAMAQAIGTLHTELYVEPKEAMDVIPQLPTIYDEPFADSSQIPTYLVSKLARQQVTVSLSGDGGDEVFGGYNRYLLAKDIWSGIRYVPVSLQRAFCSMMLGISPQVWDGLANPFKMILPRSMRLNNVGDKLHKLAGVLGAQTEQDFYLKLITHWNVKDIERPGSGLSSGVSLQDGFTSKLPFTTHMMILDLVTYLPADILVKVDRASMAVSLESRAPFLDHRLIEFAAHLPLHQKIRGRKTKILLRNILNKYVPQHLWNRPKMGFGVPIDAWLRGPLRDWAEDLLSEKSLNDTGFFNPTIIRERWYRHKSGHGNWQYPLWDVLMLQSWLRING